ncbi:MAG: elongation factor P [Spirochaetia bacterium]|nr:elongation factor P [Spirochaetia bacterium]
MINSNHIKRGMALKIDQDIFLVQSFQHHKPGKGAAIVRIKLKSLSKGTTLEKTYRSGESIEDIELDKRTAVYSYEDTDSIVFMDNNTYDQISVPKEDISDILPFMKEGMELTILLYEEKPVSILPPNFIELEVTYAEEGLKGDTATNPTKEVTLETGAHIQVPLFVKNGDIIKIDLRDFSYVERVN